MANSKYEYVKNFELEDEVMFPNFILVRINGRNFTKFSQLHQLHKPYDENALNLMNSCAVSLLEEYADIVLAYGFSDEYTFVFKKTSKFYDRRASKVLSIITSFFSSVFVTKWSDFFPQKELQYSPSFRGHVTSCASVDVLQAYLLWRQNICHASNQYDQCFWRLVKRGMDFREAHDLLKGAEKCNLNNLLFDEFNVNYNTLEPIFRQGSCVLKAVVDDIVKYADNGVPIKRQRRKIITVHSKKIAGRKFWNDQTVLLKELGCFVEDVDNVKPEYVKSFEFDSKLMPLTWIVIRIDGCHFHRFSELHEFVKPNDERALNLMNSCAMTVLEEFPHDIVFAYGVSDEYSFILKKTTELFQRRASKIVSTILSFFTSTYVMRWKDFFSQSELKYPPSFDGRAVCYPSTEILKDYLSWRQVDCHINNQYNSCFWKLVASGKQKREAQQNLKGAQLQKKIEELAIDYNNLPAMFRQGSSVFWDKMDNALTHQQNGKSSESCGRVIVEHCNIIGSGFWLEHPSILEEKQ
ncbi:tRNA(His) guanylyltransferase 1-like isoform X1 [Arachis stenosperma]|uniref:tRNA(His) guanylyltransferase 1-like isoform X1 n=2 Tax=Arachis stenosperma TaxID=217475 RepID=UPI0025AD995C|nr:tRNA(His) guanylyltransferase 1-like isoform X1 [Arachis stenosperma]XP_057725443.1 tRNA(His) guanylyltransferase 1-like isoform X1 [Arachis stenosperma]XP_057725444.1 tRNA(His) guanylyltransferase 1-like isoform X1 [Arachis stenosperma]XP_057725445.1 tRNA(His) guanylyltransferase 1-like isoform X1 [Arachis stenosperma]XP_057725446.1 tRNA(His) guanylyltransferase 1-like isoform X1 [Arachis stenosperma]